MGWHPLHPPHKIPWGDYGAVLFNGSLSRVADSTQQFGLIRTGPYVPPITFPDHGAETLVTQDVRAKLESSGLRGLTFIPAAYDRVIRSDWHRRARVPRALRVLTPLRLPEGGEPESLLEGEHASDIAVRMPPLYVARGHLVERGDVSTFPTDSDFVSVNLGYRQFPLYASDRARDWLLRHMGASLAFNRRESHRRRQGPLALLVAPYLPRWWRLWDLR